MSSISRATYTPADSCHFHRHNVRAIFPSLERVLASVHIYLPFGFSLRALQAGILEIGLISFSKSTALVTATGASPDRAQDLLPSP